MFPIRFWTIEFVVAYRKIIIPSLPDYTLKCVKIYMPLIGVNITLWILFSPLIPSIFLAHSWSYRKSHWHLSLILVLFKWNTFYCYAGVPVLETDRCVWVELCKIWLFFFFCIDISVIIQQQSSHKRVWHSDTCWDPKFENSSEYIAILSLGGEEITEKKKEERTHPPPKKNLHIFISPTLK